MVNDELIYISQKVRLNLNKSQEKVLLENFGRSRFIYNFSVAYFNKTLEESGVILKSSDLKNEFLKSKKDFRFLDNTPISLENKVFDNLNRAIIKVNENSESHFLRFKSVKTITKESFYLSGKEIKISEKPYKKRSYIYFSGLSTPIKIFDKLRFKGERVLFVTFKKEVNKYYASLTYVLNRSSYLSTLNYKVEDNQKAIGIDLGITNFLTTSSGLNIEATRPLQKMENRLKKMYRSLDRKVHPRFKGDPTLKSNNYIKQTFKIASLHKRIKETRNDYLNKVASFLTRNFSAICMENLDIKEMQQKKGIAKAENDLAFFELKKKIKFKSDLFKHTFVLADRFYPSSKRCVKCGSIKEDLSLKDRIYRCPNCGFEIDRDFNAACNLFKYMKKKIGWGTSKFTPIELDKLVNDCIKNKIIYYFQAIGNIQYNDNELLNHGLKVKTLSAY